MNRILKILIVLLICVLLGLWSPWLYWKVDVAALFGVRSAEQISGLQVTSLAGEMEVFVDSVSVGKVNKENSPLIVDAVKPGERLIRLHRISDVANAYWEYSSLLTFEESKDVVIAYALGPEKEFSEGHVIYTTSKTSDTNPNIIVNVNTNDAKITLDTTPLTTAANIATGKLNFDKQYELTISKAGFDTAKFKILPEKQEDRDKLKDLVINVTVQLIYQPVQVE